MRCFEEIWSFCKPPHTCHPPHQGDPQFWKRGGPYLPVCVFMCVCVSIAIPALGAGISLHFRVFLTRFHTFFNAPEVRGFIFPKFCPPIFYGDPKRNIFMNKSEFGHVRTCPAFVWTCQGQSRRTSPYCKPAEIFFQKLHLPFLSCKFIIFQ